MPRIKVLLDKLTIIQLVKKFSGVYGNGMIIFVFTRACDILSLKPPYSFTPCFFKIRFNIVFHLRIIPR
jgi:hypothetical protein